MIYGEETITGKLPVKPEAEFGGYFELELPARGTAFPDLLKFQSGRAALRAALESSGFETVFLPAFICDAVFQAVVDAGARAQTYFLTGDLYPAGLPEPLPPGSALLYVNYFGLCDRNVDRLMEAFPPGQLIIDNSQALFASPKNVFATIYSPRKFLGVPDGGMLACGATLDQPTEEDVGSIVRMRHMLLRLAYSARDGYGDYMAAEKTLDDSRPLRMSRLTQRILASIDLKRVKHCRRENFSVLARRLDRGNRLAWRLGPQDVPLCYPLMVEGDVSDVRRCLAERGIFVPTYWPDALPRAGSGIERRLITSTLAIPCDQRYSPDQVSSVADEIDSALGR